MKKTLITLAALAMASVASAAVTVADAKINVATPVTGTINSNDFSTNAGEYTMLILLDRQIALNNLAAWDGTHQFITIGANGNSVDANGNVVYGNGGTGMFWNHSIALFKDSEDNSISAGLYVNGLASTDRHYLNETPSKGEFYKSSDWTLKSSVYMQGSDATNGLLALFLRVSNGTDIDGEGTLTFTLGGLQKDASKNYALEYGSWTKHGWDPANNPFDSVNLTTTSGMVKQLMAFEGVVSDDELLLIATKAIPEPTTATLSLLALAGLAARRRRK